MFDLQLNYCKNRSLISSECRRPKDLLKNLVIKSKEGKIIKNNCFRKMNYLTNLKLANILIENTSYGPYN